MPRVIHPIEVESYRILRSRIDLSHLPPLSRAVAERVIHAAADLSFGESLVLDEAALEKGRDALLNGAPVYCDARMAAAGITGRGAECCLDEADPAASTRSAGGIRRAAELHPEGAIVVIGCAPTALDEALRADWRPALIIGLPVGFVGAAAAKESARQRGLVTITNVGEKGGAGVDAAACNAIVRMANA